MSLIEPPRQIPTCPKCGRDLDLVVEDRNKTGKVQIALVCPKHGSFPSGWKTTFANLTGHKVN